jgi:hypothetical protein
LPGENFTDVLFGNDLNPMMSSCFKYTCPPN